jgi:hypothetical protein
MPFWTPPRGRNNGFNPGTTQRVRPPQDGTVTEARWFVVPVIAQDGTDILRIEYIDPKGGRRVVHTFQAPS